jgi:uncharacterized protein (DUF1330 family)
MRSRTAGTIRYELVPVLVIARFSVSDDIAYRSYLAVEARTVAAADGDYIVRDGDLVDPSGRFEHVSVIRFQARSAAYAWLESRVYKQARAGADGGFEVELAVVEEDG